jgi:type III secretory pathway component EscT
MTVLLVLGLRGAVAVGLLTVLVGGMPRTIQIGLAAATGLWTAAVLAPMHATAIAGSSTPLVVLAMQEAVLGAALGIAAAVPLLAASAAGQLVDLAGSARAQGPYRVLFGVLAAAVFVGIDGHVTVVRAVLDSHARVGTLAIAELAPGVLAALVRLVPAAVHLAIPWLVTAAVVQIAVGAGVRVANRAGAHAPVAAAVPAALVMMTASLVATLAIALAAVMRGSLV